MLRRLRRRLGQLSLAGTLTATVLVAAAPVATSTPPHQVDPSTLQPALNPDFAPWSCFETGQGITCQGSFEASYSFPIGLECGGREVWLSGRAREFMTRWHTADGRATKTVVHLDYPADVFSFGPGSGGPTLEVSGHWNRHYDYPVPGDPSARVLTEKGLIYLATADGRVVLRDVGTVRFEPGGDYESVAEMHGVHDWYDGSTDFDALICDTLS